MKTYCKQCGEATEYTSRVPILCAYCGQSFGSSGQLTALTSQPKPAPTQSPIPNERRFAASNRKFNQRVKDEDDDDNQYEEGEEENLNEILNSIDASKVSNDFIISTAKVNRTPIKDVGSSPQSLDAVREPEAPQVKKAGRPKKVSAKQILAEFQKEAGTLRNK